MTQLPKLITLLICIFLVACTDGKLKSSNSNTQVKTSEQISIYKMEKETKQTVLTKKDDIKIIKKAINGANKQPGIVDMAEPQFKINLGEESYFLWITKSDKTKGTIMNAEDTHTIYSLSENSSKELNKILIEYKLK